MPDLFDTPPSSSPDKAAGTAHQPLADRIRPRALAEVIGQGEILGPEGPLGAMLAAGSLGSLILWGPPGVGKTTIARLLAGATDRDFVQISAIFFRRGRAAQGFRCRPHAPPDRAGHAAFR